MNATDNPYVLPSDEAMIWDVLVRNDFEGFLAGDWSMVEDDYMEGGFFGIDFGKSDSPSQWSLGFPDLSSYRTAWLEDSVAFSDIDFVSDPREGLYSISRLERFEIMGDRAMVHKVFDGDIPVNNAPGLPFYWRSLFLLQKAGGRWRIVGFCGYINLTHEA